jgi:hypothetical protein
MWAGRRRGFFFCLFPFVTTVLLSGCRSNCDLVEAELRVKERQIATLTETNQALQAELSALRGSPPRFTPDDPGTPVMPPAPAAAPAPIRSITLGRQTGGVDEDGKPGDEALRVQVEPRDADGHTVKVSGNLIVRVFEITPGGLKKPICSWQVGSEDVNRAWHNGLLSTGYAVTLPWKTWPATDRLRVVAQLSLADGRFFEAERDVSVRLPPAVQRPATIDGPTVDDPRLDQPKKLDGAGESRLPNWANPWAKTQPAAHWQTNRRPLSESVELLPPEPLP